MAKNSKGKSYPDRLKSPDNFPMIIMIAKYDYIKKIKEVEQYVSDICIEIEDEIPVKVTSSFDNQQDYLNLNIKKRDDRKIIFTDKIDFLFNDVSNRIKDYLKSENYNFNYKIIYAVKGPFWYKGNAGRFATEIIPAAKDYSRKHDPSMYIFRGDVLNIEKCTGNYLDKRFHLTGDDMKTLLSDLDNCIRFTNNNKITEIELEKISIIFSK